METNTEERIQETKDDANANEAEPKITSVVKEKIKDPRRVAQGKKLAAISREAKARKAKEREAIIRKEESDKCEQENSSNALYTLYAIVPVIAFGGYYFLYLRKPNDESNNPNLEKL